MPIELSLKRFPCGAMTSAPDFTHRLASGMSDVTTIAPGPARSAIQSSAASGPASTLNAIASLNEVLPRNKNFVRCSTCEKREDR